MKIGNKIRCGNLVEFSRIPQFTDLHYVPSAHLGLESTANSGKDYENESSIQTIRGAFVLVPLITFSIPTEALSSEFLKSNRLLHLF